MNRGLSKKYMIGIDEVGRGPIAGPVTVCSCAISVEDIPNVKRKLKGITDSKKLSPQQRELFGAIIQKLCREKLIHVACASVGAHVIDKKGIINAVQTALKRSIKRVTVDPQATRVYLDGGLRAPHWYPNQETIIKGDEKHWLISTASVVAKLHRDAKMIRYDKTYPGYGFTQHKGYGTQQHYQAIDKQGTCLLHRNSWIS